MLTVKYSGHKKSKVSCEDFMCVEFPDFTSLTTQQAASVGSVCRTVS